MALEAENRLRYTQYSREELGFLYSPSKHSKNQHPDVVEHHIQTLEKLTLAARKVTRCELDVDYGFDGQKLDIYYPLSAVDDLSDVLVYLHGGYWQALSKDHSGFSAVPLTTNGIALIAVGYELAPRANMTKIVEQCRRACAYARKRFPKARLTVCGHSAGGHLSACMLTTKWSDYGLDKFPFSAAVLLSGVYDLKPIQLCYVNDPLQLTDEEVRAYSPMYVADLLPKQLDKFCCVLAEGEQESPEFKIQRKQYQQVLESHGIHCVYKEILDEDHFSLTEKLSDPDCSVIKFILEHIR